MIKSNINLRMSERLSDAGYVVVPIKPGLESIFVALSYLPGDDADVPSSKVKKTVVKGENYVLGSDSNYHNNS